MEFRLALDSDISAIVAMLAHDPLGKLREDFSDPLPKVYLEAYARITEDPNQELIVLEDRPKIIGTLQLSFIQYLTYQGGIRAQIEAVRVHHERRNEGLGEKLFLHAIQRAKDRGAHLLQLTTDKKRPDALRFYEKLGFSATHEGMKMHF